MSHFVVQPQKRLFNICPIRREDMGSGAWPQNQSWANERDFELSCLVRAIQADGKSGLLSRVTYSFRQLDLSSQDVLRYAEVLNCLLIHSQVFVIQDIDGDRHYSLQMDTLLSPPYRRRDISDFLDHISQDAGVLVQYCRTQAERCEKTKQTAENVAEYEKATDMNCKRVPDIKINVTNLARARI